MDEHFCIFGLGKGAGHFMYKQYLRLRLVTDRRIRILHCVKNMQILFISLGVISASVIVYIQRSKVY